MLRLHRTPGRLRRGVLTVVAAALTTAVLLPPVPASAGSDDGGTGSETEGSAGGDFAVTVNGRTYNPAPGRDTRLQGVVPTSVV